MKAGGTRNYARIGFTTLPYTAERIDLAWRLALGRLPTDTERTRAAKFLQDSPLSELCRGLFNLNEFVYVD